MDNNYPYIAVFSGFLLVFLLFFYFISLQKRNKSVENIKSSKTHDFFQEQFDCDGDKCVIKQVKTKYEDSVIDKIV